MAEPDDRVARRYRELAREEPPPLVDQAILASARRAVAPAARTRWAVPVSIAAVLVLGIGVSLRMQLEKPGIESAPPDASSASEYPLPAVPAPSEAPKPEVPATKPAPRVAKKERAVAQDMALQEKPAAERAASAPAAPPAPIVVTPESSERSAAARSGLPPPQQAITTTAAAPPPPAAAGLAREEARADSVQKKLAVQARQKTSPTDELDRIAKLRAEGKHAEADKALAAFHADHPEFRIPDATWERVRPR